MRAAQIAGASGNKALDWAAWRSAKVLRRLHVTERFPTYLLDKTRLLALRGSNSKHSNNSSNSKEAHKRNEVSNNSSSNNRNSNSDKARALTNDNSNNSNNKECLLTRMPIMTTATINNHNSNSNNSNHANSNNRANSPNNKRHLKTNEEARGRADSKTPPPRTNKEILEAEMDGWTTLAISAKL